MPAQAGIQGLIAWIRASAGMTKYEQKAVSGNGSPLFLCPCLTQIPRCLALAIRQLFYECLQAVRRGHKDQDIARFQ